MARFVEIFGQMARKFRPTSRPSLKHYLPKGLVGRALLIIMLPIALMQIIIAFIFFESHWQTVSSSLANSVAADIAMAHELYAASPSHNTVLDLDAMMRPNVQLSMKLSPDAALPLHQRSAIFSSVDRTLRKALENNTDLPFWFDTTRYPHHIDIRLAVEDGVLTFIVPRERVVAPTGFVFLFWLVMITVLLSLISILFILNQVKPISKLAKATEDFGKGRPIGKFKPSGATEVRQASTAFLDMRDRILRHIQKRTDFLAGVSHDLRTPLTRLKLHLSLEDETPDTKAAKQDVKAMEMMLDSYLEFARNDVGEEKLPTDIIILLSEIIETANHDKTDIQFNLPEDNDFTLNLSPVAIRRALCNVIENACGHGNIVRISAENETGHIQILIADNGPGIAVADRREALKPFTRLDTARNQNRKGVGLGLALANDIIQSHGGTLALGDHELGGLLVQISLPR